jgi:hypothetical protein
LFINEFENTMTINDRKNIQSIQEILDLIQTEMQFFNDEENKKNQKSFLRRGFKFVQKLFEVN